MEAAMDVANDVKGTVLALSVIPERLAHDGGRCHLFRCFQDMYMSKDFPLQSLEGASKLLVLIPNHMRSEVPITAILVSIGTDPLGEVQNNCYRQHVMLTGESKERLAGVRGQHGWHQQR